MAVTWVDDQEFYQLLDKDGSTDDIHSSTRSCESGRTTTITTGHTGALDGQTPYERLVAKMRAGSHRGVASAGRSCSSTPAYLY
jgi:hypothetical protein